MNAVAEEVKPLKLDLGCGVNKKPGFLGVDRRAFDGVDVVADLTGTWPWADNTVEEINLNHVLEHFSGVERVHIFNEMYRVLIPGGKALIATPHWCANRAYGDFTHQWPPVSEMLYWYLSKTWRKQNAPDNDIEWNSQGYNCDFEAQWGYTLHPELRDKAQERVGFSQTFYKEACQDLVATLTAKK